EKRVFLVILFTSFSGSLVSRIPGAVHHPCVGMAGPAIEKLTNVSLMRRISVASGNNVGYEKRKHIDESDLNPIFISFDSVNPAICIRSE
ncbi:hypothetical protein, partial [Escherichia coli]|uniref:hypothetical protein n=1 Tax=Escherichia coli TaxID=562 RepID=UPI001A7E19BF